MVWSLQRIKAPTAWQNSTSHDTSVSEFHDPDAPELLDPPPCSE